MPIYGKELSGGYAPTRIILMNRGYVGGGGIVILLLLFDLAQKNTVRSLFKFFLLT